MKLTFKQHLLTSIACSAAFALVLVACGGGNRVTQLFSSSSKTLLASAPILGGNLVAPGSSSTTLAAMFQIATPINTFAQSFHGRCLFQPASTGIFTNNSSSDVYVRIEGFGDRPCNDPPLTLADLSDPKLGAEVIDAGTINSLIVVGINPPKTATIIPIIDAQSGQIAVVVNGVLSPAAACTLGANHRCAARTLAIPVVDGDHIAVYEKLPPGKDFIPLEVYLAKN